MSGNSLKRPPRGWAADHPLIEDLKRKDFTLTATIDPPVVTAADFASRLEERWSHTTPFMRFVTEALGLSF